ncbi:helix-turn-helix domain-containing protein [Herbivorax sp. ANBcel31]|uniref:helix-turn-helix domain-containing protein n=1 Tax=Herbivorax sp. ANBcel31 TaxID=3069754 RepID=UPI0027ADE024|nr:helix-turn-helix domain-containing protein [Herbivorax sp. ANBcel31]MDQ2086500.1 helix-turn-helix domain-containing protein [Herbivorax sp. ANBcel31]
MLERNIIKSIKVIREIVMNKSFMGGARRRLSFFGLGRGTLYRAIQREELRGCKPNSWKYLVKISEVEEWIMSKQIEIGDEKTN